MKLIPMTDFVLQEEKKGLQNTDRHLRFEKILKYAKFLKKPLKLEMFVPCDEDGNIILFEFSTNKIALDDRDYCDKLEMFEKAKAKVLFKNFIKKVGEKHVELLIEQQFLTIGIGFKNGTYKTIEDLANNLPFIKLTDSATKQFLTK